MRAAPTQTVSSFCGMTDPRSIGGEVPFHEIIKAICGCEVLAVSPTRRECKELLDALHTAGMIAGKKALKCPIFSRRINEVGNKMEPYVKAALGQAKGVEVEKFSKTAGYPDIAIRYKGSQFCYIECKTYSHKNLNTSHRSFYLSPSPTFKVTEDAYHFLFSYEMREKKGGRGKYVPVKFTMVDLRELPCALKYEWNSNNLNLYAESRVLRTHDFS